MELAKYRRPDLILMDLRMPVMVGFKATEALRSMPEFTETSIVAMSVDSDEKSIERCLTVGFTETAILCNPTTWSVLQFSLDLPVINFGVTTEGSRSVVRCKVRLNLGEHRFYGENGISSLNTISGTLKNCKL